MSRLFTPPLISVCANGPNEASRAVCHQSRTTIHQTPLELDASPCSVVQRLSGLTKERESSLHLGSLAWQGQSISLLATCWLDPTELLTSGRSWEASRGSGVGNMRKSSRLSAGYSLGYWWKTMWEMIGAGKSCFAGLGGEAQFWCEAGCSTPLFDSHLSSWSTSPLNTQLYHQG